MIKTIILCSCVAWVLWVLLPIDAFLVKKKLYKIKCERQCERRRK